MRFAAPAFLLAALWIAAPAAAADLRERASGGDFGPSARAGHYESLWAEQEFGAARSSPRRPPTRIMGGPGYVGSNYGLGKPAYSGVGPRPDWGRSSVD